MKRMSNKDADRALRALEQRVPEMDDAALDALNAQAYEKFMQRRKRRGRMHRRIAAVCAATLGILVVSFGFSVFFPNMISKANNEVKKASLWMSEKLNVNLKFDQPIDDESLAGIKEEEKEFFSIEEAVASLKMPVVGLLEESGFVFEKLKTVADVEDQYLYKSVYKDDDWYVMITAEALADHLTATVLEEQKTELNSPIGYLVAWKIEKECRAILFTEQYVIQIASNLDMEQFEELTRYFTMFTQP